jgi:hypothetical protein
LIFQILKTCRRDAGAPRLQSQDEYTFELQTRIRDFFVGKTLRLQFKKDRFAVSPIPLERKLPASRKLVELAD